MPVLSEQIIFVLPRVSTAVSLRITALRLDILVTPIERTIVTSAAKPSGMAATAKDTAIINVSSILSPVRSGYSLNTLNKNINTLIPKTNQLRVLLNWLSFICRGVAFSSAWVMASAILPISVSIPVATIRALPLPYTTVLPIYTMFFRSPRDISFCFPRCKTSKILSTGTLSPVRAASSIFRLALSKILASAGIESPASKRITSPTTRSSLLTTCGLPSRITLELAADIACKASIAFSALLSWYTPRIEFITTTPKIMITSANDSLAITAVAADIRAATNRMMTIGSLS